MAWGLEPPRILWVYWDRLRMVARVGGYYRTPFQGFQGVMQGYPVSPTIFNVVVDAGVQHWVAVVVEREGRQDGRVQEGQHQSALFYMDDNMVASSDLGWLHGSFSILIVLYD